ncbi:MAG: hypothetical protein Q9168_007383, partial [Polycauliona sp. 1 TL-2023]
MAAYNGRKGPNVSHFLSNLNAIPSDHEIPTQQPEPFDFANDLASFTNTEFFDFDQGENAFNPSVDYNRTHGLDPAGPISAQSGMKPGDL